MKPVEQLQQQLDGLQTLTRVQRMLRLALRVFWLGFGGVMLAWGLNAVWGWLPNPLTWILFGVLLAVWPLINLADVFSSRTDWVWRVDRRLGLHEQVSTAWHVAQKSAGGPVSDGLLQDVNRLLPRLRRRVLRNGWFLEFDLVSAVIVMLLGMIVLGSYFLQSYAGLLGNAPSAVVAPAMPPPFELPQPSNPEMDGQTPQEAPGGGEQEGASPAPGESEGGQPGDTPGQGQPEESQSPGSGAVDEILRQLGSDLSGQAGTYDLGQALENMDLEGAAEALEDLTQQLDDLSQESRDNLAQALQDATGAMEQSGQQSPEQQALEEDMRSAAEALQQQADQPAGDALNEMAGDLRDLAQEMGSTETAGGGAGTGEGGGGGSSEPLSRLQGESGDMELPLTDPSGSSLLTPGSSDLDGDGVADGESMGSSQPGDDVVQSPLVPGSLLWKWRNVVSQFFQR